MINKKNFLYYTIPTFVKGAVSFCFMIPLMTYYLDPKDFGVVAALGMVAALIIPLSATGYGWVLPAHYHATAGEDKKIMNFNIIFLEASLKIIWCFVFVCLAKNILPFLIRDYEPVYLTYFYLAVAGIFLNAFWPIFSFNIVLGKKGAAYALMELGQYFTGVGASVVCLVSLKLSVITLFISPIVTGIFSLITGLFYMRNEMTPKLSRRWLKEIFRTGLPTMPSELFETFKSGIDRYFIQSWINLTQLGIYAHSYSYRSAFMLWNKTFSRTFGIEALEVFTLNKDPQVLKRPLTLWYGILGIGGGILALFSYEIVDILTHGKFVAAAPLLPIWFLLVIFHTFGIAYFQYIVRAKKAVFLAVSEILVGLAGIGIGAALIYMIGALGAVISAVLSYIMINLVRRWYSLKMGCPRLSESDFVIIVALLIVLYSVNLLVMPGLILKIVIYAGFAAFVAYKFKITDYAVFYARKFILGIKGPSVALKTSEGAEGAPPVHGMGNRRGDYDR